MNSSKNLDQANSEIAAIMKKYDVGGCVILCNQDFVNYYLHISPSWSCITIEGNRLRFNNTNRPEHLRKQFAEQSTGLIMGSIDGLNACLEQLQQGARLVAQHFSISHFSRKVPPPSE